MKKNNITNITKQIICIIITLMLCNFIIPNCAYAVDTAKGGSLMEAITQFLCFIPDSVIGFLQDMFVTPENIKTEDGSYSIKYSPGIIFSGEIPAFDIDFITPSEAKVVETKKYNSTAAILQRVIATWYNALRRIALVGLLSVIVYIGIKIVLSSTSAKDRAKYKAMLKDWVIALCLLFVLHYIMSITITVVDKINDVIKASSITANGEDILLTSIRNKILNCSEWSAALTYVVIYTVISVLTIIYTIQYVRRVIYIGFLTAIAPLITLTYPLDKIKDGKAQAFDMWVKDYIFFALIQVVHLLVYYIFLGNSMDLADSGNWLFALVAIGFITQAEKLIKKMFGFEKSKTLGAMSAGITGALIMNAIQKVSQSASKKETSKKEESSTQEEVKKPVRTAGVNQFVNYNETNTQSSSAKPSGYKQEKESKFGKMLKDKNLISDEKTAKVKTNIRGAKAVVKKYSAPIAIGTLRLAAKTTGGLLGFSAAVANGEDISGLVNKTVLGAASADGLVNVASKGAVRLTKIPEKVDEVVDTYREEVYGKEAAQNAKFDRVFRRSKDYEVLRDESGFTNREFDQKLQKILDAGIDDPKRIKKILKNHKFNPQRYTMDKAIRFSKLADQCSKDILYDKVKFIRFCQDRKLGLSEEDLITLRKDMMNFK